MELSFDILLKWISAFLVSIGGGSILILAISKWFGGFFASKLLEKDKAKYSKDLEQLKGSYQTELEKHKAELEKSKALFLRYSEHQFKLYNDLWVSLCDLKETSRELWESAEINKLKKFAQQLRVTKSVVEKSAILIEDEHYNQLINLISQFENYELGKQKLINVRNRNINDLRGKGVDEYQINNLIEENRDHKVSFEQLLDSIQTSFKTQMKG